MTIDPISILLSVCVAIVLFLLFREIITWYWKINHIVNTLDRIDANLIYMAEIMEKKDSKISAELSNTEAHEEGSSET